MHPVLADRGGDQVAVVAYVAMARPIKLLRYFEKVYVYGKVNIIIKAAEAKEELFLSITYCDCFDRKNV